MFTFRTSITFAVMAFIFALAALLIAIQVRSLQLATKETASAYMEATSTKVFGRLELEITAVGSLVSVLATSSSVADSNERTEVGRAIPLFKTALQVLPQMDSIYVGFENGAWLQVRRLNELNDEQRKSLRATPEADIAINFVRPTESGELPMRRIFEGRQGDESPYEFEDTGFLCHARVSAAFRCGPWREASALCMASAMPRSVAN